MHNTKKMIKLAGFMVVATIIAKFCGLFREIFIGQYFGTGFQADAFFIATRIPTQLFDVIIGGAISAALIPIFNEYLQKESRQQALEFANKFINVIFLITSLIAILGIAFSSQIMGFMTSDPATKELAVRMSVIMFPAIIFTGLTFSFVGILQSFGEFNIPAIISLVFNGIAIAYLLIFKNKFGVTGLAVAMLVGWILQVAVQIPSLIKFEFNYRLDFNFNHPGLKKALMLAIPLLISTWVQPIGNLVNTYFASSLGEGVVSALGYANGLYIIIVGVFSFVVTNLIFPSLSRAHAVGNEKESSDLIRSGLKSVSFIIFPIMAGAIILANPIVRLLYERGAFDAASALLTSTAFAFYAIGMIGFSYAEVLNKSFFAMQNSKTPMITALISIAANIILSYFLSRVMGIGGLALGSTIAATLNAAMNFIIINKKIRGILDKLDAVNILKIIAACIVMAVAVWVTYTFTVPLFAGDFIGKALVLFIPTLSGIVVYLIACIIFKVNEIGMLLNIFKRTRGDIA